MTGTDYIDSHLISMGGDNSSVITEDDAYDAVDIAVRDLAWEIHKKICDGASMAELDHYVCGICDF